MVGSPAVVGAAAVAKLTRNVFLAAVVPLMAVRHGAAAAGGGGAGGLKALAAAVPQFVLGFVAMAALRTVVPLTGIAALAAETCLTAGSIYGALPVAIAIFPQEISIPTSALEPEFQNLKKKDGSLITSVVCNKGL